MGILKGMQVSLTFDSCQFSKVFLGFIRTSTCNEFKNEHWISKVSRCSDDLHMVRVESCFLRARQKSSMTLFYEIKTVQPFN